MKPWKKLYFKSIKCFKRVKIDKWPDSPYSFSPIDYCVRINGCQTIYSVVIFSHRFLDSDCINFKTFAFLTVYWPFWTSLYNTDIKVQKKKLNRSSTLLNNVFKHEFSGILNQHNEIFSHFSSAFQSFIHQIK